MARKTYAAVTKLAFTQAAKEARDAGKPWSEAFAAATEAGYTGSVAGLKKMMFECSSAGTGDAQDSADGASASDGNDEHENARKRERLSESENGDSRKDGRATRFYDESTKTAILRAVAEARASGKSWAQAYEVAKSAGYRGKALSLMLFIRNATPGLPRRGPGRPPRVARDVSNVGMEPIQQLIDRIVNERVQAAIDRAIQELQRLRV